MAGYKAAELRQKDTDELLGILLNLRRQHFGERMRSGEMVESVNVGRKLLLRRDIARVLTILREKREPGKIGDGAASSSGESGKAATKKAKKG